METNEVKPEEIKVEEPKTEVKVPPEVMQKFKPVNPMEYVNKSCKHCHGTGTYGFMTQKDGTKVAIRCNCMYKQMQKDPEAMMKMMGPGRFGHMKGMIGPDGKFKRPDFKKPENKPEVVEGK